MAIRVDIDIYDVDGEDRGIAQAKYLVHGVHDLMWTDDLDEALAFLKDSIEGND